MLENNQVTILCLASYFKGTSFLVGAKQAGARVLLLTREKLREEPWPWESVDEVFYMPTLSKRPDIEYAVSYLVRSQPVDRIVPLDDYDVETAAHLREHLRLEGLNESTSRFFRDKLAMRLQAKASGLAVPAFTAVFNYDALRDFMQRVSPPWLLKPRSEAGAMGIKMVHNSEEVWRWLDQLGDEQSFFLLEQFITGEVYHVDSIVYDNEVVFAVPHKYGRPPMSVAHEGGVFMTRRLATDDPDAEALLTFNRQLLHTFGLKNGASHTEFLKSAVDGRFYFVETAARVGGANIEQLVEAASGINLWAEWAKLEIALVHQEPYPIPHDKKHYAGLLVCLAKQEYPDLSHYQETEIVFRLHKKHHAGLVCASPSLERVNELLNHYSHRFAQDFLAVAPPLDKPPS
ncbi:MAG: ATP-grasp domain-containing protein [Ardenticatenaceae bacterium]|nr:ATP-grasp domain-containing protein [Anaerolineales bacterium]MCB8922873.1 ATP-grasp domain-containing protein [Ardenticatenaceae bacterium]